MPAANEIARRRTRRTPRGNARAELQAWYLTGLSPKLARAAAAGVARPGAVEELDRQLRALLELPEDDRLGAAA